VVFDVSVLPMSISHNMTAKAGYGDNNVVNDIRPIKRRSRSTMDSNSWNPCLNCSSREFCIKDAISGVDDQ